MAKSKKFPTIVDVSTIKHSRDLCGSPSPLLDSINARCRGPCLGSRPQPVALPGTAKGARRRRSRGVFEVSLLPPMAPIYALVDGV